MDILVLNRNESLVPAETLDFGTVFEYNDGETFGVIVDDGAVVFPAEGGMTYGEAAAVFSQEELQDCLREVKPRPDLRFVIGVEDAKSED